MRLAVRLGLAFVAAAFLLAAAVVASGGGLGAFVALLLLLLLGLRATLASDPPDALRVRLGAFVFVAALAFAFVVAQRVRSVLNL